MEIFAERLTQARTKKNLTQAEVSELIGVSIRAYQNYEAGRRVPYLSIAIKLAQELDVSLDYLCGLSRRKKAPL